MKEPERPSLLGGTFIVGAFFGLFAAGAAGLWNLTTWLSNAVSPYFGFVVLAFGIGCGLGFVIMLLEGKS